MLDEDLLLSRGAIYKKVKKGETIFKENTKCNYYFQLVQGKVSWINYDDEGKIFIQSIIEPNECFGELPLFDDEPYAASAIAETNSVIIQLPKSTFLILLKEKPELLLEFTKLLAQRVRYKFFILKELACHNPEQQIVEFLNYYKNKSHQLSVHPYKVTFTRQQLADMTGLRVETVIRVIKKLSENGKLNIDRGKVYLSNTDSNHKNLAV